MNINLTEFGDCIVVRGVYRETGHLSVLITDLENQVLAQISKDLPNASTLSEDEFYFIVVIFFEIHKFRIYRNKIIKQDCSF